jgi:hypothetical protein
MTIQVFCGNVYLCDILWHYNCLYKIIILFQNLRYTVLSIDLQWCFKSFVMIMIVTQYYIISFQSWVLSFMWHLSRWVIVFTIYLWVLRLSFVFDWTNMIIINIYYCDDYYYTITVNTAYNCAYLQNKRFCLVLYMSIPIDGQRTWTAKLPTQDSLGIFDGCRIHNIYYHTYIYICIIILIMCHVQAWQLLLTNYQTDSLSLWI